MKNILCIFVLQFFLAVPAAQAAFVNWTDWTSYTGGTPGSATGNIGGITVNYTGDVDTGPTSTGINYWTENSPAPYTGNAVIDNAPTAYEMVALSSSSVTNIIRFSQAVLNPVMAIVSLGRVNLPVTYDFDTPFTVLSEGQGYWGDGTYSVGVGDTLTGYELHGAIQFQGLVSSISWTASPSEFWHGITVGTVVPEPSTYLLMGIGLLTLLGASWRRKSV